MALASVDMTSDLEEIFLLDLSRSRVGAGAVSSRMTTGGPIYISIQKWWWDWGGDRDWERLLVGVGLYGRFIVRVRGVFVGGGNDYIAPGMSLTRGNKNKKFITDTFI